MRAHREAPHRFRFRNPAGFRESAGIRTPADFEFNAWGGKRAPWRLDNAAGS